MSKENPNVVWRVSARDSEGVWTIIVVAENAVEAFMLATQNRPWFIKDGISICAEDALFPKP